MKEQKHSTTKELEAFSLGTLSRSESEKVGKHLLHCADCRKAMPPPSKERLWATIMKESEVKEILTKVDQPPSILSEISSFLKLQSDLIWVGTILLIFLSFSFLLWINLPNQEKDMVQTFEKDVQPIDKINASETKVTTTENPNPGGTPVNSGNSKDSNKTVVVTKPRSVNRDFKEKNAKDVQNKKSELIKKEQFSLTRGGAGKCREENIGLEFFGGKESFVFKWKKIQNAANYHLYISDDDEILIDEYETKNETTFELKKALDPLKTYKWKIIVTLEDGKKIIGASQKFTVKNFQTNQLRIEKEKNSDVRCSAKD